MPLPSLLRTTASACVAAALASLPALAAPPATDWPSLARQDLNYAADIIRTRHAGFIAAEPSVTAPLEAGLHAGLAEAGRVRTEQDYTRLMERFFGGFGDQHTDINLRLAPRAWTGLVLDQLDGRYRVAWSEPGWPTPLPPLGAEALACDGVWIGSYLHTRVNPYNAYGEEYPGAWRETAQRMMIEFGDGGMPKQCVFALPDGSRRQYALEPRTVPAQVSLEQLNAARRRVRPAARPVGLYEPAPGMVWIGMPDFDGARSGKDYEALYFRLGALPREGWVVFDLRGNGGGNSAWGSRALGALYGEEFMRCAGEATGFVKYMTANQATADLLRHYMASPQFAASKASFAKNLSKVEAAIQAGQPMALVSERGATPGDGKPVLALPHGPRIAAVIDRACFSSCQNFLMQLRTVKGTVVLGEASIGFSPFGEINSFELPSGRGTIHIPSALFLGSQGTREPFLPDVPYGGNIADDAALTQWVVRTLNERTAP